MGAPGLGLSASASWEVTVRGTRCVRCRMAEALVGGLHVSVGATAPEGVEAGLGVSSTSTSTRNMPSLFHKGAVGYLVMGIISAVDRQPVERIMFLREKDFKNLFWKMRLETVRLRGLRYFLSLKSVKAFRLYRCVTSTGAHKQLELDSSALSDLKQLRAAYKKRPWPPAVVNEEWARWVVDCLDGGSLDILNEDAYSLEIVLGWSPSRISIAVLSPVALSLIVGFWFNSRDWTDLATIQTAWGVASYIATAGGCKSQSGHPNTTYDKWRKTDGAIVVAAVLGIISGLADT